MASQKPKPVTNWTGLGVYIKKKLAGRHFKSKEELFEAIKNEWLNIPNEKLHNYYSFFLARCYLCKKYDEPWMFFMFILFFGSFKRRLIISIFSFIIALIKGVIQYVNSNRFTSILSKLS